MCGRYSQFKDRNELFRRFNLDSFIEGWSDLGLLKASYNIAPTQYVPVVVKEPSKHLRLMSWGLIPSWAKDQVIGQKMINARSETLTQKASFKRPFVSRRCIVPATGFYEWAKDGKQKVPMHFVLKSGDIMGFGGLWDIWKSPNREGRDLYSFAIITTSSNELLSKVHNRMLLS